MYLNHHLINIVRSIKQTKLEIKHSGDIRLKSKVHEREFLIDYRLVSDNIKKPIILFIHGFKGFKDWGAFNLMADYFANAGYVFIKMNFSHNGTTVEQPTDFADLEAFGNNNFTKEQNDITTVLDYITAEMNDQEYDLNDISLIGHSRGGAAAILATARDARVKRLATLAALNYLSGNYPEEVLKQWKEKGVFKIYNARTEQDMPLYYQIVEDYYANKENLDVRKAVESIHKPFLAFHGTADETLPVSMLYEMKEWNQEVEIIEIPGMNHTFGSMHPHTENVLPKDLNVAVDLIIEFFKKEV